MEMSLCGGAGAGSVTESRDACRAEALAALAHPSHPDLVGADVCSLVCRTDKIDNGRLYETHFH